VATAAALPAATVAVMALVPVAMVATVAMGGMAALGAEAAFVVATTVVEPDAAAMGVVEPAVAPAMTQQGF